MKCLVLLSLLLWSVAVQCNSNDDDRLTEDYMARMREALGVANNTIVTSANSVETVGIQGYDCELTTDEPTSVHNLSPKFVDVVAAMGDSVTAGFGAGAKTILTDIIEYRGLSWSIGGNKDLTQVATLPNILKTFNPNVKGFSVKTGKKVSKAKLNVAVSGAKARGMPEQAETLVKRMADLGVTDEDWKVITIWIGGNDMCAVNKEDTSPDELAERYVKDVETALDYLKTHVPRAFVNVVQMIDVADLSVVKGFICTIVHEVFCSSIRRGGDMLTKVSDTCRHYNDKLEEMVAKGKYDDTDDFTVVLQPFFSETEIPRKEDRSPDTSFFAPDCFHFSQKGHAVVSRYLWNNMFQPIGLKSNQIDWTNMDPLLCPVDSPYFATSKNSKNSRVLNSSGQDSPGGSTNLVAILVGTGVGVLLVAMAAIVVIAVLVIRMKRGGRNQNETLQLLSFKS